MNKNDRRMLHRLCCKGQGCSTCPLDKWVPCDENAPDEAVIATAIAKAAKHPDLVSPSAASILRKVARVVIT